MAVMNVSPTRMELSRVKERLDTAVKGHRLLKDKRDELMRRFLELIRETETLRRHVESKMTEVSRGFALASSVMRKEALVSALMMPGQSAELDIASNSILGVEVPVFKIRKRTESSESALSYGYAFTSEDLDSSVLTLAEILPELLRLAEKEKTAQLMAAEIEKTRRRVNALEYTVIPNYKDTVRFITMKLDENERGNLTRLMKVKDMMVEKQLKARGRRT